jgi:hypothetical protein
MPVTVTQKVNIATVRILFSPTPDRVLVAGFQLVTG